MKATLFAVGFLLVTLPSLTQAVCTCDDNFDYFSEIRDDNHYDYTDFPYFE